jgi:4-diphosphocytidyl-2-C-methyl-D-erythritol kinase
MIHFPNAKINLGLHITSKRPDGFHEVETILYPVKWCDALEIVPDRKGKGECVLEVLGADFGDYRNNLCFKAYQLLHQQFNLPSVKSYLQKVIPHGAGLGGGSSDAASTLIMLNELFSLHLTQNQLSDFAASLGSDCAFFIYNKPMLATGKGEVLHPIDVLLENYFVVIIMPPVTIGTKEAYSLVKPGKPDVPLHTAIKLPIAQWKYALVNDFEKYIFDFYPLIGEIKKQLYINGAIYASMSGSGSSVFGVFPKPVSLADKFPDCKIWTGNGAMQ